MEKFSESTQRSIQCAVDILLESRYTTVLTGAGISTPSGIPDFRSSSSGLWSRYDPFEVASLSSFRYNPAKFYDWMRPLAKTMYQAKPNAAHTALANLESHGYVHAVITQNIDSLHVQGGSMKVIEIHGSMRTMTCIRCYRNYDAQIFREAYLERGDIPTCERCQGILKPDVILMEEQLPVQAWHDAVHASEQCSAMLIVGSSLEVVPVANLPMMAVENGSHLIIVNNTKTYIDVRADVVISHDLIDVIPAIAAGILDKR